MDSLGEAIESYQAALETLENPPQREEDDAESKVFSALIARDKVAHVLADPRDITPEELKRLAELDERLESRVSTINPRIKPTTLATWLKTVQPAENAWWWSLFKSKPNPLWGIFAGLCITGSLSITAEISRRFLSVGPDFLGVFSTLLQGLLALLAGSTFTEVGREWIERVLSHLGTAWKFQPQWKTGLALAVLFVVLALRFSLPTIARFYNEHGVRLQRNGQVTRAIESYRRAIRLNPDSVQAHYNLATAYEDVLSYNLAITEYQTAIGGDDKFYAAINNLARLYILRRKDDASALELLKRAFKIELKVDPPKKNFVQYSFYKNRGWAYFGLKYYGLAEADLRQAIARRFDGAAAHCLLAQVLEAQKKGATEEWEACIAYASGEEDVEESWLGLAKERLKQGETK
jgi:tetratricopeptide (TPR) repeat protein